MHPWAEHVSEVPGHRQEEQPDVTYFSTSTFPCVSFTSLSTFLLLFVSAIYQGSDCSETYGYEQDF